MPLKVAFPRVVVGEIMDTPGIDPGEHLSALAGLRRINRISGVVGRMAQPIHGMAKQAGLRHLTILDVACGGGDVPIGVAHKLRANGIEIHLTLLDQSATAIQEATAAAAGAGIPCTGIQSDALGTFSAGPFDIVTNSLFLHHLKNLVQVTDLLRSMRTLARRMVLVSDLRRSRAGYVAAWMGCRLLSRSSIVHFDGPASVRAAWTDAELCNFAAIAGLDGATIHRCHPWRMLLNWSCPARN